MNVYSGKPPSRHRHKEEGKIFIPKYIQQDAMLHSLFYLETALHVLGDTSTRNQERIQLYLHHLVFVTPLLLSAANVEELELQFQLFQDSGR
jgi:hypothetical protein